MPDACFSMQSLSGIAPGTTFIYLLHKDCVSCTYDVLLQVKGDIYVCELCRKHGKGEVPLSLDPPNQSSVSNGKVCLSIFGSNV